MRMLAFILLFFAPVFLKAQDTMVIYLNDSVFVRTITKNGKLISEQKIRTGYDSDYTQWLFDRGLFDDVFMKAFSNEISEYKKNNFYDAKGKLVRTEIRNDNYPTVYFHYIPEKMISIRTNHIESCYPVGSEVDIELEIKSHTDIGICLYVPQKDSNICVLPLGKNKINVNYKIKEGDHTDSVLVKNDSIHKKEILQFFGYTISSVDFDSPEKKIISKTIFYYRSGNETLLNVYSKKKKDPIKRITLGNFKNTILLDDFKKGEYIFEIVDYTNNTKKKLPVILK